YAFWRDPIERFCSAVEFHKRCLPNSFIQLFPERFVGIEPHSRWFETDADAVKLELRAVIGEISPAEILSALPPPPAPGVSFQPRGGNLSFYRPQTVWMAYVGVTDLDFDEYEAGLREIVDRLGGNSAALTIPQLNAAGGPLPVLDELSINDATALYEEDIRLGRNIF
ncbi:MAG: hypothetical protein CFE32_15220, partial [Alphaproteobacteria bacterium PA3]